MPESVKMERAQLRELDTNFQEEINPEKWVSVQFNPETLKVSFANQIATPSGTGNQQGGAARLFVGAGTTKLAVQIWFDVSVLTPNEEQVDDVRRLTQKVAYFITPKPASTNGGGSGGNSTQLIPSAVRFAWGTFLFDGIMDSLEESLEFWSNDGRPLRASMSLALSQQKIEEFRFGTSGARATPPGVGRPGGSPAGTTPLVQAPSGATLQSLAADQGAGGDWQSIAAANGIENPRRLVPGQLIDLNARAPR